MPPKLHKRTTNAPSFPTTKGDSEPSSSSSSSSEEEATSSSSHRAPRHEMRQSVEQRERAAMVLGSWERLSWYSRSYGESIPQTRLRFQKILYGLDAESEGEEKEWEDEKEGDDGGGRDKGKEREKEKGKERGRRGEGAGSGRKRVGVRGNG
ncbi:hypothetical protein BDR22DRAFT_816464 [Usnea florida]